jgi:hypothetical protein
MNLVNIKTLLPELRNLVAELAEDLIARSTSDATIDAGLREAFHQIEKGGRTAQAFEVWREDYLDQVAVAWVLACVFVRFLEDNELIEECWLAGEAPRRRLAEDTHELFFRERPHDTDREYFQHVFKEVGSIAAANDLFAIGKTPLWAVAPSGDAAMQLLKFWREIEAETGHLKRSFQVENGDTRFLGDLYQELSERAKKKFALLQTPVFVEEFILDRTLTPALAEFGLEKVRMIDPTCGSGHFLLGGFARLFDLWSKREGNEIKAAQMALDGVWGVDINPFAVAIARFRLIVAACQACGIRRLKQAPGWTIRLATGDSLLFGSKLGFGGERVPISQQMGLFEIPDIYAVEDRKTLNQILGQGYHVVVGNPPYIIVRDQIQNAAIRESYSACIGKYSLGVPFTQRFWGLAIEPNESNKVSGYVGLITANSFMKREFGKKLIEEFLSSIDLTHMVDTSGAYIPGHGTPTVILLGRNRRPIQTSIRAVLGINGEPGTPEDASKGLVWRSIERLVDSVGSQNDFVSVADVSRTTFASHPWSIGGGGAAALKEQLDESVAQQLARLCGIGIGVVTLADEVFQVPTSFIRRQAIPPEVTRVFVTGDIIRDWNVCRTESALFPHDSLTLKPIEHPRLLKILWPFKPLLSNRLWFRKTPLQRGLRWFEYGYMSSDKCRRSLSIAFAEIATHNHFVLDQDGRIFNQTAPIITLPSGSTEDAYFGVLGLLNSSTIGFYIRQICMPRRGDGVGRGMQDEHWEGRFAFNATQVGSVPIPEEHPTSIARTLHQCAQQYLESSPQTVMEGESPDFEFLAGAYTQANMLRGRMIALQEELDWHCYKLYGLISDDLRYNADDLPVLALGERAFEVCLARSLAKSEIRTAWFERHGSEPITELPRSWPASYRDVVERRISMIENDRDIGLIEKPEYKRRWNSESWQELKQQALMAWLLNRLETPKYRRGTKDHPELTTTAQMADVASADTEFLQAAADLQGRPDFSVAALVAELVEGESVPLLPILRYKPSGLRKREVWERTWNLQRQQDAGTDLSEIPVPPKYAMADFLKPNFWRLRGKLDVPKERWISFPHCSTESDPTLVVGWAGWNHLEQATALIGYYDARKREGWDAKRLTPLLAGLDQLLPWIHQWHPEIDAEFGETAGQSFQTMLEHDAHELGLTVEDIRNWTPPERVKKATKGRKKKVTAEDDE